MKVMSLFLLLIVSACDTVEIDVISMIIEKKDFDIVIPATGELEAAQATNITSPTNVWGQQTIAWIAEENTAVKEGEVIVRFDGEKYQLDLRNERFNVEKMDLSLGGKKRDLGFKHGGIENNIRLTDMELLIAEKFAKDDIRVFSRNDIIDSMQNKDYLSAKSGYYRWQLGNYENSSAAELNLLETKKEGHMTKLQQHESTLEQLEITAPHDGIFVYEKMWTDEKPRVGMSVWMGMKIGKLPDLSHMQAKIFVQESEAAGLAIGQNVDVTIDAYPDEIFKGVVEHYDALAKPLEKDNPVKYFEVVVKLDKTVPQKMHPGRQVKARIFVEQQAHSISVPNQAIFHKEGDSWVYVKKGSDFIRANVKLGRRSLTRTLIIEGLEDGDEIALISPEAEV